MEKNPTYLFTRAVDSVKERSCENLEFTKHRTDKKYYGRRTVIHCAGIHLPEGKSVPEFRFGWLRFLMDLCEEYMFLRDLFCLSEPILFYRL